MAAPLGRLGEPPLSRETLARLVPFAGWTVALGTSMWLCGVLIAARRLPAGDAAHFIATESRLAGLVAEGELLRALTLFFSLLAPHPPLGYLPGVVAQLLWPDAIAAAVIAQGLVLLLGWDGLRRLFPQQPPMGAWMMILGSPMVWLAVDQHGRDLVVAVVALQALSHLLASDGLRVRTSSLAFGAWMGVGFMVKYTFPMFLFVPCLLSVGALISAERRRNLSAAVLTFVAVAGPWYAVFGSGVRRYLFHSTGAHTSFGNYRTDLWATESIVFYPLALKDSLGWPGVTLLGVSAVVLVFQRQVRTGLLLIGASAGGLAVLSTINQAQDRYAAPALLLLAALAGAFRGWTMVIPLALGLIQTWYTARAFAPGARTGEAIHLHPLRSWTEASWPRSAWYRPTDIELGSWKLDEAFTAMAGEQGEQGTVGLLLGDQPFLPAFGSVVLAAQGRGYRWDYGVVKVQGQDWTLFRGPLFDGAWPPGEFRTLLSILCPSDSLAGAWRSSRVRQTLLESPVNGGCTLRVDVVALGPLPALDGPVSSERADGGLPPPPEAAP